MPIQKDMFSYGNPILMGELSNVIVGKFCSISDFAKFDCGAQHNNFITTFPLNQFIPELEHITSHPKTNGDIIVGNDVWIADSTIIMSGVKIGNGAIIGAGAIVRDDVDDYEIVRKHSTKNVHEKVFRFNPAIINALLQIRWWDWPYEKIVENGALLMSKDFDTFIEKHL